MTDAGLAQLEDMRHLTSLTVEEAGITDAGLVVFERLAKLEDLTSSAARS